MGRGPIAGPGISVKLSALHPRYEPLQAGRCVPALIETLTGLALAAKAANIGLTVDAEEADRLEISLDIFSTVLADQRLADWDGLGLAVQAYQKRALPVIDWIAALAQHTRHRVPTRLVKGAYWDSEIKLAQVQGHPDYPVFTRKAATDVSWLACARRMLEYRDAIYPSFATHNAHSLAFVLECTGDGDFEAQRLHGMGEALYHDATYPVRVYAPVGTHEDLLAYLVRRLLENGANTSFVHRLVDPSVSEETIVADPVARLRALGVSRNPRIALPRDLYPDRVNSSGIDLADRAATPDLLAAIHRYTARGHRGCREIRNPADRRMLVGAIDDAGPSEIDAKLDVLAHGWREWDMAGGAHRAAALERAADLIEASREELLFLLAREGGKTLSDGIAEVREAADYCRWYALQARRDFVAPRDLPGPTGECNTWGLGGRGVFAAISPWNFPLAIFTGQVAAALAAGNAVAAKPAEQTPLVAVRAVALLIEAGVPPTALALLPGDGTVGQALVNDQRIAGVAFTGGTETAQTIARSLAARGGPIVPFIAETGGINAMIVDSSALPEQVVTDVIASAFGSAGQRCSALRLLCLQDDIADRVLRMLHGAAETLLIGDPIDPAADVGPVIDEDARTSLERAAGGLGKPLFALPLPRGTEHGSFFAPRAFLLRHASELRRGDLRSRPVHCALCRRPAGRTDGRDRRYRLRPDAWHPQSRRGNATAHCRAAAHRQHLRQSQPDWRGGRRAAVRRARPVRHGTKGGWPDHAVSICGGARRIHQHCSGRRQCGAARLGRRIGGRSMIGVDWGTTSFRAFRVAPDGGIRDRRTALRGLVNVPDNRFADTLREEIGPWLAAGEDHVLLSGMIGSRQGWQETPYLPCPAGAPDVAAGSGGHRIRLGPGEAGARPVRNR